MPTCPPGTGRTGLYRVPPNSFPFYSEAERYTPAIQTDGGQLSGRVYRLTAFKGTMRRENGIWLNYTGSLTRR